MKMAEILLPRKRGVAVAVDSTPAILLLILACFHISFTNSQLVNRAPHFVPQSGDLSHFSLSENTAVGTPVYQLKGIDPDGGQLHYSISGQHFTVDRLTGVITLVQPLDREKQDQIEVIISITDEAIANTEPNTISLRRLIKVRDANDNAPIFQNRPYSTNVSEDAEIGSEVTITPNIIVTDLDEGVNADIQVTCHSEDDVGDAESCFAFRIQTDMVSDGRFQVRVFVKRQLDYESRSSYILTLRANDRSDKPLVAYANVAITVNDVQDQPPIFLNSPYSATVLENTEPGVEILSILAKDGDKNNPRQILITLEDDILGFFEIISERGSGSAKLVTSNIPIDREDPMVLQNGGVYSFSVKATELINNEVPTDYTISQVTIVITDVDDHIPTFNQDVFDVSIPENIEAGSPVPGLSIYVDDKDLGVNSKYDLSLRFIENSEGVFVITSDNGEGRTPVGVKVKDATKLDYDIEDVSKRHLSFDIVASVDGMEKSSARININLLDVNDNAPIFENNTYRFNVKENASLGFKIANVSATDKDSGVFGALEYELTGFGSNFFRTDTQSGGVYVNADLDYEEQKSYSLNMVAKDGGGKVSTANVFIDLIDVNDNEPYFEFPEYSRTIRDGATSFEPQFVVRAFDTDGPTQGGGKVKYSIESDNSISNNGNVFTIDENTGEIMIINTVNSMDTPRGQYDLIIKATDQGFPQLSNETRVFIRVGVAGNQRPTFKGNYHNYKHNKKGLSNADYMFELNPMNYKATIREDATPGQDVTTVIANDPDGQDNLLTYHIVGGSKDNFVIDERSGLITVSSDANLDRDANSDKYEIVVTAVDGGTPIPETATTTVFVTIQDVNDKAPYFVTTNTTIYISEKTKVGDIVTTVEAMDTDVNSKIKFTITALKATSKIGVQLKKNSPYEFEKIFTIDSDSGDVIVNNSLDYSHVAALILTIEARDINAEVDQENQFALLELTIYIQPYSDKNPQFTNPGWTASHPIILHRVKEEQPIGSTLLVLMADDPISGHLVSNFKVINSEVDLLQIDPNSGQVMLMKRLDYEDLQNPNVTLSVKATSNDGTKYSVAKLIIQVININDNIPEFDKEVYRVSILESMRYPEQILTVKATDGDAVLSDIDKLNGYSDVRYYLSGENSELFLIDKESGVIKIAPNKTLDRERQSVMRFDVVAYDTPRGGSDQVKNTAQMLIDILDVNDNNPRFSQATYTAVVPENVHIGVSVINMTAIDPDEGIGGEIKYDIMNEGEANGLFHINSSSGEIRTKKALTGRGRTEPYMLVVRAQDGGELYGDTNLMLYIGDVSANDGIPLFIKPAIDQIAFVSENATIGSTVFQVVASDPDDPTQPSGKLYYTIQQTNSDSKSFEIDSTTGLITTKTFLDRERKDTYMIVLVVVDRGEPPQQASRILQINVTDVDDHKPRFLRMVDDAPLLFDVDEEISRGTVVGEISAVDEDIGPNGAIDYEILSGNDAGIFELERREDNKALIKAAGRIDREEASHHRLVIKCFKLNTTPVLNKSYNRLDPSEIQVIIKVNDIDDHLPEFPSANMSIGVRLNVPVDTVLTVIRASDRDVGMRAIDYTIHNITFVSAIHPSKNKPYNTSNVFSLNNVTGELRTLKSLMHFSDGSFRLVIRANNSNDPERFAELILEMRVVRERDLLRFVFARPAAAVRRALDGFAAQTAAALAPQGLQLSMLDARVLTNADHSLDFTSTSSCFQLTSSGRALSPAQMEAALARAFAQLGGAYAAHGVATVGRCAGAALAPRAPSLAQAWLLAVAALVGLAALVAACTVCCMHRRYRKQSRKFLLAREPPSAASYMTTSPRMYTEPIYTT